MVSQIHAIPKQDASELRKLLDGMKRAMPEHMELLALLAKMDFAKFEAYVAAGFKPEQALDLLKAEKIKASV